MAKKLKYSSLCFSHFFRKESILNTSFGLLLVIVIMKMYYENEKQFLLVVEGSILLKCGAILLRTVFVTCGEIKNAREID